MKEHSTGEPGAWKRQAQEDLEAWDWKQYSFMIAIKARRQMARLQMTQKQLAERTGITQADISRLETGNANPSLRTLQRLAAGMGKRMKIEFQTV